jgi:SAM-dependent methyltransferase
MSAIQPILAGSQAATAPAYAWTLSTLSDNPAWKTTTFRMTEHARSRSLPFRLLRYWFMERLLAQHAARLGRPLQILELGVDRGQMKLFVDGAASQAAAGEFQPLYQRWDAADCAPNHEALTRAGYGPCDTVDLDDEESLANLLTRSRNQYDAVILLHVLEHLKHPERALTFAAGLVRPGGVLLGGFPVLPSGVAALRERQLRKTARPFGHISAFSPARLNRMARQSGLEVEYARGAFGLRISGSRLENQPWWVRANLAVGHCLPGWPGELYWSLRRPQPQRQASETGLDLPHLVSAE